MEAHADHQCVEIKDDVDLHLICLEAEVGQLCKEKHSWGQDDVYLSYSMSEPISDVVCSELFHHASQSNYRAENVVYDGVQKHVPELLFVVYVLIEQKVLADLVLQLISRKDPAVNLVTVNFPVLLFLEQRVDVGLQICLAA